MCGAEGRGTDVGCRCRCRYGYAGVELQSHGHCQLGRFSVDQLGPGAMPTPGCPPSTHQPTRGVLCTSPSCHSLGLSWPVTKTSWGGGCSGRGCVPQACPCCWSPGWALPLQGSPATSLHALAPPLPTSVPQGCSAEWRAGPGTTLPASPGLLGSLAELTVWESAGPWYPPTALQDQGPGSHAPWFPAAEGSSDRKLLLWPSPVPEWPASRRSETPAMPQCPSQTGPAVVSLPCLTLPPPLRILPASLPCLVLSHLPAGPQPFSPAATAQLVWAGSSPGTELI